MARPPLPDKKRSARLILLICLIALGILIFRASGCKLVTHVETLEWID